MPNILQSCSIADTNHSNLLNIKPIPMSVSGLGTRLFIKVPRPGDSEGTFSVFEC